MGLLSFSAISRRAWFVSNDDLRDIAEKDRSPIRCRQHRIPDIVHRADQSDAADDRGLLADVDGIAAQIDVAVAQGLKNLWQREAKCDEPLAVALAFKCFRLAAPARTVRHSPPP